MARPSIVARGAVGLRKEASFASGGAIDNWQVVESASLQKTNVYVYQDRVRNTPEQIGGRFAHTVVGGNITFPVSPQGPTEWWEIGIGGTGPYTPQLPLSSLAIEIQEGDVGANYSSGDRIGSLSLSSSQGDILRCTVSIEAKDQSARTAGSPSFTSGDDPFLHSEGIFTLDGVVNDQVTAFSVTKDNNLITDVFGTGRARREIPATKAVVTGSISILFENTTHRNRFFNQLPSAIIADYVRGSRSFKIELVNINYDTSDRPLDGQTSFIIETLNFTAFVNDPAGENSIKLTVDQT